MSDSFRATTSVTLPADLLEHAIRIGLNVSAVCERGLRAEIALSETDRWMEENREALLSSNAHVVRHGLPLARHRQF